MSFQTEADEHLQAAKADIQHAIWHIGQIIIQQCVGSLEFGCDYRKILIKKLSELIEIREVLG